VAEPGPLPGEWRVVRLEGAVQLAKGSRPPQPLRTYKAGFSTVPNTPDLSPKTNSMPEVVPLCYPGVSGPSLPSFFLKTPGEHSRRMGASGTQSFPGAV